MIEGTIDYHHSPAPPADHGPGRRCAACAGPVSRYTEPQPLTGIDLCNQHWHLPEGYTYSATGRIVKEAA